MSGGGTHRHGGENKHTNSEQMKDKWWSVIYQLSRRANTRREGEKLRREGESLVSVGNGFARFVRVELYESWQEALKEATGKLRATTVATDKATINFCTRFGTIDIAGVLTKTHTAGVGWSVAVNVFDNVDYEAK